CGIGVGYRLLTRLSASPRRRHARDAQRSQSRAQSGDAFSTSAAGGHMARTMPEGRGKTTGNWRSAMTKSGSNLDRVLVLEMVRVTEAAAIAAAKLIGRGDEKAADAAAVEAMRAAFNDLYMDGTVVIGEGERDEAPMLYIGEKVGNAPGKGPKIDIALDPLEGTTITAKAGPTALAVLAIAEEGCLLNAPDVYMEKIAIGPGYPEGTIDLNRTVTENIQALAAAKGVQPDEIICCVLDRPR